MPRILTLIVATILLLSAGCKSKSVDLADRSVAVLEGALILLEENQETTELAPEIFRAYMERNQAEVDALVRLNQAIETEGLDPDKAAIRRRFLEKMKPLNARLKAMAGVYGSKPNVLAALKRIHTPSAQ